MHNLEFRDKTFISLDFSIFLLLSEENNEQIKYIFFQLKIFFLEKTLNIVQQFSEYLRLGSPSKVQKLIFSVQFFQFCCFEKDLFSFQDGVPLIIMLKAKVDISPVNSYYSIRLNLVSKNNSQTIPLKRCCYITQLHTM